jgi:hypothetical protein
MLSSLSWHDLIQGRNSSLMPENLWEQRKRICLVKNCEKLLEIPVPRYVWRWNGTNTNVPHTHTHTHTANNNKCKVTEPHN